MPGGMIVIMTWSYTIDSHTCFMIKYYKFSIHSNDVIESDDNVSSQVKIY